MLIAGIPAYRVKVCAGWVMNPKARSREGHAYVIYLAQNGKWYCLDWCYWPKESIKNFKKLEHKDNSAYQDIWFTFNNEYVWGDIKWK